MTMDQVIDAAHLARQREWSQQTFGPGTRLLGVIDHIRKELVEVEQASGDLSEWVDVLIIAFDGAMRSGSGPQQIIDAIKDKMTRNAARTWPDWRTMSPDTAIEHVRAVEAPNGCPGWSVTPMELAEWFHNEYERLAPRFNYKTRKASAVPWGHVPAGNRRLMIAVATSVLLKWFPEHERVR